MMLYPLLSSDFLGERQQDKVSVEILLIKKPPKPSRKERNIPLGAGGWGSRSQASNTKLHLGHCDCPVNPSEDHPPSKASALSIPSESFSLTSTTTSAANCYSLLVKVHPNLSAATQVMYYVSSLRLCAQ